MSEGAIPMTPPGLDELQAKSSEAAVLHNHLGKTLAERVQELKEKRTSSSPSTLVSMAASSDRIVEVRESYDPRLGPPGYLELTVGAQLIVEHEGRGDDDGWLYGKNLQTGLRG